MSEKDTSSLECQELSSKDGETLLLEQQICTLETQTALGGVKKNIEQTEKQHVQEEAHNASISVRAYYEAQAQNKDVVASVLENIEKNDFMKHINNITLTDIGIDKDIENAEAVLEDFKNKYIHFQYDLTQGSLSLQNAANSSEIDEEMRALRTNLFSKYFDEFIERTGSSIDEDSILFLVVVNKGKTVPEYQEYEKQIEKEKGEEQEKAVENSMLYSENLDIVAKAPKKGEGADKYISSMSAYILDETHSEGRYKHLVTGGVSEPFMEVIDFVKSGGNTVLTPQAYEAYINILNDKTFEQKQQWLEKKVGSANRARPDKDGTEKKFTKKQNAIITSDTLYQLSMQNIAKEAEKIMNRVDPNTQEKINNPEDFIQNLSSEDAKAFIEGLQSKNTYSYTVKNTFTDTADSSLEGQTLARITPTNIVLDQIIRSGAMATVLVNLFLGFRSGNWSGVMPYIAGGAAVSYGLANGVMNSGFEKIMNPERMLDNILKESWNNEHYRQFFGNPWEVALVKNMNWPAADNKKEMKKDLKTVEKDNGKVKYIGDEKISKLNSFERNVANTFEESLKLSEFQDETSPMAKYLSPDKRYLGPDGVMYSRDEFLDQVAAHTHPEEKPNHVRFQMYEKIASRIGEKDSYLPYLNQLHQHYANLSQ